MKMDSAKSIHEDLFASSLRSQINQLEKVLHHVECGNPINDFVEAMKTAEKNLRRLRKFYFNYLIKED